MLLGNRLINRIIKQGWLIKIIKLIRSFLIKKTIIIYLKNTKTELKNITCGILQSSLVLLMLYILYLYKLIKSNLSR